MADGVRSILIKFLGDGKGLKAEGESMKTSLGSIKTSIQQAEGASGRFKAAAGGAFSYAKDHAGQLAMAGGAALVGFGIKAVHAFEDTAKAAIDLGATVGATVEDASRMIAVADDFNLSATDLEAAMKAVSKTTGEAKWAEWGVDVKDAGGNLRSTTEITIDALAAISALSTEQERSAAGLELFGKGWGSIAPMVGHTREEYEQMLGAVSDGQVITANEAKKAERMRLAEDALADAIKDVQLAVGGMVAEYAPFIERTASAVSKVAELTEKVDGLAQAIEYGFGISSANPIAIYDAAVEAATEEVDLHGLSLEELEKILDDVGGTAEFNRAIFEQWAEANGIATEETAALAEETKHAATEIEALGHDLPETTGKQADLTEKTRDGAEAQQSVQDAIDDRIEAEQRLREYMLGLIDTSYAYMQQVRDTNADLAAYNEEVAAGGLSADELATKTESARQSLVDVATAYADTTGAAQGSNAWISAVIESLGNQAKTLDPASPLYQAIQGYIQSLKNIPTYVETTFGIKGPGVITVEPVSNRSSGGTGAGAGSGTTKSDGIPGLAEGGIVKARPGGTLIRAGEARRDEAVVPLPEHGLLGGGSLTVIVEGSIVGDAGVRQLLDEWWWARQSEARGNR